MRQRISGFISSSFCITVQTRKHCNSMIFPYILRLTTLEMLWMQRDDRRT
jgi:hypothetical protein